jgi:hypothetical protein
MRLSWTDGRVIKASISNTPVLVLTTVTFKGPRGFFGHYGWYEYGRELKVNFLRTLHDHGERKTHQDYRSDL